MVALSFGRSLALSAVGLAMVGCASQSAAPIEFAFAPEATRTGTFFTAVKDHCITPLPDEDQMRARLSSADWQPLPEGEAGALALTGYDVVVLERRAELSDVTIQIAIHRGRQLGEPIVGCSIMAERVDADALELMLSEAGYIEGDPFIDMDWAPAHLRSWYLRKGPVRTPPFGIAIESNDQDGSVMVSINQ